MTGIDSQVTTSKPFNYRAFLVRLEGFEPPTLGSVDRCSNPLSYSRACLFTEVSTASHPTLAELGQRREVDFQERDPLRSDAIVAGGSCSRNRMSV